MNLKMTFSQTKDTFIQEAMDFVHESLLKFNIESKQRIRTELLCEEAIAQMATNSQGNGELHIQIKKSLGDTFINLRMSGEEFDISTDAGLMGLDPDESHSLDAIRSIVLMSYGDNIKYSNKKKENRIRILASRSSKNLYITLFAMIAGICFGLATKLLIPEAVGNSIADYVLNPFTTMFMNGIKMILAPVVFLSIVTCFSQYGSVAEFGRVGAKVMASYLFTTVFAILLSFLIYNLIQPGEFGFALNTAPSDYEAPEGEYNASILNMLVGIVPSNFLAPFVESNTLQLIFIAAFTGIALGMIGDYASILRDFFEALNSLFLTITRIIIRLMPIAAFCSMATLLRKVELSALGSLLSVSATSILAIFCMLIIYGILILVFARLNPIQFFKKAKEGMLTSFTLNSSSAAMPTNLKVCTEKLGISPKICNFSIPLGATVNMDGSCVLLVIVGLFLAKAYGVEVQSADLLSIAITIALLSLGAPGIPGANLFCFGVLLNAMNVPIEAIGLILGIDPLLEMFVTMSNTTGDMAVSLIVAKQEKQLDLETYNS